MSMDFTEFKRRIGAEPRSGDPEILAARDLSPEHREAVIKAEVFEQKLERAVDLPVPDDLLERITSVTARKENKRSNWWPLAMAASVLVAVGAAGVGWKMNQGWESVEAYVMDHYRHDGEKVVAMAQKGNPVDVHEMLARFDLDATPELAGIISLIKYCPTPEGKGIHMILDTQSGPLTVIYMPDLHVTDREMLAFDKMQALLVDLESGSAAIIGADSQGIEDYYAVIHDSIVTLPGSS